MTDKERKRLLSKEHLLTLIQEENIKMNLLHQKTQKKIARFGIKRSWASRKVGAAWSKTLLRIWLQLRP